jgi:hypothetical protein
MLKSYALLALQWLTPSSERFGIFDAQRGSIVVAEKEDSRLGVAAS